VRKWKIISAASSFVRTGKLMASGSAATAFVGDRLPESLPATVPGESLMFAVVSSDELLQEKRKQIDAKKNNCFMLAVLIL
jgi:hypothetical protein